MKKGGGGAKIAGFSTRPQPLKYLVHKIELAAYDRDFNSSRGLYLPIELCIIKATIYSSLSFSLELNHFRDIFRDLKIRRN